MYKTRVYAFTVIMRVQAFVGDNSQSQLFFLHFVDLINLCNIFNKLIKIIYYYLYMFLEVHR